MNLKWPKMANDRKVMEYLFRKLLVNRQVAHENVDLCNEAQYSSLPKYACAVAGPSSGTVVVKRLRCPYKTNKSRRASNAEVV
jgi:hypothetical protein